MKINPQSYLQQLENNEAILLMYLADELPEQDRAEVDQMLASDAALRSELDILRQTLKLSYDTLETLDAATRPPIPPAIAQGRVSRLIRDWSQWKQHPLAAASKTRRTAPWLRGGLSAAAVLLVSYYVWFAYHPKVVHSLAPLQQLASTEPLFGPDDPPSIPPLRDLTNQEKITLLSNSLEDSVSDESSNLHVSEVAAMIPSGGEPDNSPDADHSSDQNPTGEP